MCAPVCPWWLARSLTLSPAAAVRSVARRFLRGAARPDAREQRSASVNSQPTICADSPGTPAAAPEGDAVGASVAFDSPEGDALRRDFPKFPKRCYCAIWNKDAGGVRSTLPPRAAADRVAADALFYHFGIIDILTERCPYACTLVTLPLSRIHAATHACTRPCVCMHPPARIVDANHTHTHTAKRMVAGRFRYRLQRRA